MADSSFSIGPVFFASFLLAAPVPSAQAAETDEAAPDMALLEFLGSFSPADEAWLDTALDEEQEEPSGEEQGTTTEDTHHE